MVTWGETVDTGSDGLDHPRALVAEDDGESDQAAAAKQVGMAQTRPAIFTRTSPDPGSLSCTCSMAYARRRP